MVTAAARFAQMEPARTPYLDRGRECSELTIPSLLPRQGHNATSRLPTPYQGMGARGVNNLASKLLLALLPPNSPFFRLRVDDFTLQEITGGREDARSEVEEALGAIERSVQTEIETQALRVSAFEALKHLLVTGNVLLYLPPEGGMKVYRLDRYVVKRDPMGNLIEGVVKETIAPVALPKDMRDMLGAKIENAKGDLLETVDIYTHFKRFGGSITMYQEVEDLMVPGSDGEVPVDKSPFIALRWAKIDGEDYGRGHVEEYLGDLRSLEGLMKAIVEGSAAAAKMVWLVDPNGNTSPKTIAEAPNLAVRSGNAEEVSVLQAEKYGDFRVAQETATMLQSRLSQAFLLMESITRDAERVTAEEIRQMASELEDALGGVYSILTQELQLPLVNRVMYVMQQRGDLPQLPQDEIKPAIVTGMEALGRGHDLNRLLTFGRIINDTLGPDVSAAYMNPADFIKRVGTNLGIDTDGLIKTQAQLDAERQRQQSQQILDKLGPEAMRMMNQQQDNSQ